MWVGLVIYTKAVDMTFNSVSSAAALNAVYGEEPCLVGLCSVRKKFVCRHVQTEAAVLRLVYIPQSNSTWICLSHALFYRKAAECCCCCLL